MSRLSRMTSSKKTRPALVLEPRNEDVEVEPVDALDGEGDVATEDFGDGGG